jgi:hypothetical protein
LQLVWPVEPRARRQALRLHLAEARTALDRGDLNAAREAVSAALDIDPSYLAALTLKERLEQAGVDAAPPLVEVPPPVQTPVVSSEGWFRFEQRARQRRVEKRTAAAKAAIAHGRLAEARAIMAEIREIDAAHPDLISLQMEFDAAAATPSRSAHWGPIAAAVAAFCALLLGARYLEAPRRSLAPAPVTTAARTAPVTTPPAAAEPQAVPPPSSDSADAATQRDNAAEPTDNARAVNQDAKDPAEVGRSLPRATSGDAVSPFRTSAPVQPPPSSPPLSRPDSGAAPAPSALPAPAVPVAAPPMPESDPSAFQAISQISLPRPPAPEPVTAAINRSPSAGPSEAALTAATTPRATLPPSSPAVVDVSSRPRDEDLVRGVLQQYRLAYEHLDARSAAVVWPRVDAEALQRAFAGLASQRLTFDQCDVRVGAGVGTAVCHGSTRYVPRIGSREPRVEPRVWTFALQKVGDAWRINSARAEQ